MLKVKQSVSQHKESSPSKRDYMKQILSLFALLFFIWQPGALYAQQTQRQSAETITAAVPGWLTALVVLACATSVVNLYLYYQLMTRKKRRLSGAESDSRNIRQTIDFEIYPAMERKHTELEKKIDQLRRELHEVRQPNHSSPVLQPVAEPSKRAPEPAKPVLPPPVKTSVKPTGHAPGNVVELEVKKPVVIETAKPTKKYADYPKENGFVISQLQDSEDRRSIFELTIPPDGEQAAFTIVDNKDIHAYAIQNRERLLRDACDFEITSSLHTRIVVENPGKLQKNGNVWQIVSKARIRFM